MATDKIAKAFRFSDTARELLEKIAQQSGISQTAVLELLIREKAKAEGITAQAAPEGEPARA